MSRQGRLFVVAVPIGHPKDITLRAIDVLQTVDAIICEEYREGSTVLSRLGINNELVALNEHNEESEAPRIVQLLQAGQSFALISDCGTPVFADPGHYLLRLLIEAGIPVVPIPGPSSLTAALSICEFPLDQFVFGGFLPRDKELRRRELQRLRNLNLPIVLMDTPYRLTVVLEDVSRVFGATHPVTLACDLTLPSEVIYRGSVGAVVQGLAKKKAEFVLIIR